MKLFQHSLGHKRSVYGTTIVVLGGILFGLFYLQSSHAGYGPQTLVHDGHTYTFTFSKSAQLLNKGFYKDNPALQGKDLQGEQTLRVDAGIVTDTDYPDKYPNCYPGVQPLLKARTSYGAYSVCPIGSGNMAIMYFEYQGRWHYMEIMAASADTSAAELNSFKKPLDIATLKTVLQSIKVD